MTRLEFISIPAPMRRMMVAQEVIDILDRGLPRLTSHFGNYCTFHLSPDETDYRFTDDRCCNVCAVGALMLGHLRLFGEVRPVQWDLYQGYWDRRIYLTRETIYDALSDYFSADQLCVMERVFEDRWNRSVSKRLERLRIICQNIINNSGFFRPFPIPVLAFMDPMPAAVDPVAAMEPELVEPELEPELELVGA